MSCIRALWILASNPPLNDQWRPIYTRRFAVAEKRAQKLHKNAYVAVPRDSGLVCTAIVTQLGVVGGKNDSRAKDFVPTRDSCKFIPRMPVIRVSLSDDIILWPVVVAEHFGHLLCCLPLLDDVIDPDSIVSLLQLPPVTSGLAILMAIQTVFGSLTSILSSQSSKLDQLDEYISFALPFGRPGELDPSLVTSERKKTTSASSVKRPILHYAEGKSHSINIRMTEFIKCIQYGQPMLIDLMEIYGSVTWNGLFAQPKTEVTLNLSSLSNNTDVLPLELVAVHPCVTRLDQGISQTFLRKFSFVPQLCKFQLCHYIAKVNKCNNFPIRGSFSLSYVDSSASISLSLELDPLVKNNFHACEVNIPFVNASISDLELNPSWGGVLITKDRKLLIWNLGNKFPPHSQRISIQGNVKFSAKVDDVERLVSEAHASVLFKISDFTLSGYSVDVKSIHTSAATNTKMTSKREFVSVDYKIWNSKANVPVHFHQKCIK